MAVAWNLPIRTQCRPASRCLFSEWLSSLLTVCLDTKVSLWSPGITVKGHELVPAWCCWVKGESGGPVSSWGFSLSLPFMLWYKTCPSDGIPGC